MRSPEALQRLYSEVHLLSTLHHDSIISFHTSWVDGGKRTFNFITEMFTSGTLREYRQRYRRVDIRAVKNWARQILHGLCDNIFVNGHLGQVKIGDLGLAAILRGSQAAHSVIGTPEFMAPELYDEVYNELMLTGEYPYNECSNPAQIYRKVTLGKLPDSFYRVKDPEARRFIGRCLEHDASKRSPAKELLLDPFLLFLHGSDPPAMLISGNTRHSCSQPRSSQRAKQSPDMKITGKINSEGDTIILKVQITDKQGEAQNIYFPFDVVSDSPMDVATEMVRELEITYRDPSQIAEMIAREVSALVPDWKDPETGEGQQQSYVYGDEDDSHPFHELSSSTSTQGSMSYSLPSHHTGVPQPLWTKGIAGIISRMVPSSEGRDLKSLVLCYRF
ncbi:unnamed protein product [Spirodela intermedia]|uniref:non-specific serine/threonine protein kinase n=1 Tax=Spirodela intermedia TaxID=51605 RepID=A0A7I8IA88_SPIIN|nr:unnamed protein product [Spirodela intermedia]CAA6654637.1 unnamed protein product [Spirodela intermedia]